MSRHTPCGCGQALAQGRSTTILSRVARTSFMSRAVGAGHRPTRCGTPWPGGQQAPLDAVFAAVRWGWGRVFSPPNGALVIAPSILEPLTSRCPAVHRTAPRPPARAAKTRRPAPTPDTDHGRSNARYTARSDPKRLPLATGAQARRRWHRRTTDPARAADRRRNGACSHATGKRGSKTAHKASETRKPVVVLLFRVRARVRLEFVLAHARYPPRPVIRIGS